MTTAHIEKIDSTRRKIKINVPKEKVANSLNKAYQKVGQKAQIKGFRPGKIPNTVLDQYYGPQVDFECLNFIIGESYTEALTKNNLMPMTEPSFDTKPVLRGMDYDYSVELDVRPEFDLKDYKGIEIKKQVAEITDAELADELKRLQESLAQLAPVEPDTKLTKGLVATIDFDGTIDGKPFDGGTTKDYVFEFGQGQLLKEFEAPLEGLKIGETAKFDMAFPADYFEKKLAGLNSSYNVTLKNLHKKALPALDDEMAKDIGKESLEQVKTELKDALVKRKEGHFRHEYAGFAKKHLTKIHMFDVPQSLVDEETKDGKREKQDIIDQIKLELILDKIAEVENIRVTPRDVDSHLTMLSQMYRQPLAEVKKLYSDQRMMTRLVAQIVMDKTLDFVVQNAKLG